MQKSFINQKTEMKGKLMNVVVGHRSILEQKYEKIRKKIEIHPEVLEPGFTPTPSHDLVFRGGNTIANLSFSNFYIGNWKSSEIASIDWAISAAMSDQHLNNVVQQYFTQNIENTFKGSSILDQLHPKIYSKSDLEKLIINMNSQRRFNNYDIENTIFNFVLPKGTILKYDDSDSQSADQDIHSTIDDDQRPPGTPEVEESSSLGGLGGFHGSVITEGHSGQNNRIYYSVSVYSEYLPDGRKNGIPVFDESWKNIVATLYHEINEFKTDPDVEDAIKNNDNRYIGWNSDDGEEIGDFPVFEASPLSKVFKEVPLTNDSRRVPIQLMYSNWVHGPEGPISTPHR